MRFIVLLMLLTVFFMVLPRTDNIELGSAFDFCALVTSFMILIAVLFVAVAKVLVMLQ